MGYETVISRVKKHDHLNECELGRKPTLDDVESEPILATRAKSDKFTPELAYLTRHKVQITSEGRAQVSLEGESDECDMQVDKSDLKQCTDASKAQRDSNSLACTPSSLARGNRKMFIALVERTNHNNVTSSSISHFCYDLASANNAVRSFSGTKVPWANTVRLGIL